MQKSHPNPTKIVIKSTQIQPEPSQAKSSQAILSPSRAQSKPESSQNPAEILEPSQSQPKPSQSQPAGGSSPDYRAMTVDWAAAQPALTARSA